MRPGTTDAGAAAVPAGSASARLLDSTALSSGPASITGTQPSNGALADMIASRCKRLRHSNEIQRDRYLSLHQTLASKPCSDTAETYA